MFTGFSAEELQSLKTDGVYATTKHDFFGNGKPRLVAHTEPSHRLRRTLKFERNGRQTWNIIGEFIAFGPRGAVWQSMRFEGYEHLLKWVNIRTNEEVLVTKSEDISLAGKAA